MQYKTYQDAKIANPESEIHHSIARGPGDKGFFSTIENATGFFYKCKPKDHCVTLESFLASGKKIVKGDIIVGKDGKAITVKAEYIINMPTEADCGIYVVKAKALENPAHEWVNGDEWDGTGLPPVGVECIFTPDDTSCGFNYIEPFKGTVLHYEGEQFVFMLKHDKYKLEEGALVVSRTEKGEFEKLETESKKLDRQRLESAYHLACIAGAVDKRGGEFAFDKFKQDEAAVKRWLAVVDETKYLLND